MTPADRLKSNAGWVKQYHLKGDRLFSTVDVQDSDVVKKLPGTIRWTSPWINSFTDGNGREWKNVISHLALTTRPRIVEQEPFGSVAAALSLADPIRSWDEAASGVCLSNAGLLERSGLPAYPIMFSMYSGVREAKHMSTSGAAMAGDFPPKKKPTADPAAADPDADMDLDEDADGDVDAGNAGADSDIPSDGDPTNDATIDLEPLGDPAGDVSMVELLCDLLGALGIHCETGADEATFKRGLYNATMTKIHELTAKGQNGGQDPNRTNPPGNPPNNPKPPVTAKPPQPNPLIQQEQPPMFMSLEDIHKLPEPMKGVALAMYSENQQLRAEMEASKKVTNSLRDAKIREAELKRTQRVSLITKLMPRAKTNLEAMLAQPGMAMSIGEKGVVVDPMAQTLEVLEQGLADLPRLLTTDQSALSVQPQPTDEGMLSDEATDAIADSLARAMGCPSQSKAS